LDAELVVGGVNENVVVTSEAAQLQTETAKVSTAVQNRMVDELPLVVGVIFPSRFDLVSLVLVPEARSGTTAALASGLGTGQGMALGGPGWRLGRAASAGRQVARERMDIVKQNMQYYFDAEPVYLD
ncbi:MAG TPA: hypothetical protein VKV15_27395, partial [Bryobacteraceae bacterium]|nr:hypothetical protein [Bryobacteraceae bacterium]